MVPTHAGDRTANTTNYNRRGQRARELPYKLGMLNSRVREGRTEMERPGHMGRRNERRFQRHTSYSLTTMSSVGTIYCLPGTREGGRKSRAASPPSLGCCCIALVLWSHQRLLRVLLCVSSSQGDVEGVRGGSQGKRRRGEVSKGRSKGGELGPLGRRKGRGIQRGKQK